MTPRAPLCSRGTTPVGLSDEGGEILDGRYGAYAALLLMTQTMEAFAENSLTPAGKRMAEQGAIMGRRALARPHMKRLARELDLTPNPTSLSQGEK